MKVLAEIGQKIQGYFNEMDRQAKEKYYQGYKSPETVAAFQFHTLSCTKTGPLEQVVVPYMDGGAFGGGIAYTYKRCVECKGSERDRVK